MNDALTHKIIGAAFEVHNTLGAGFLEKVYENALCLELNKHNLEIKQQFPIEVTYKAGLAAFSSLLQYDGRSGSGITMRC